MKLSKTYMQKSDKQESVSSEEDDGAYTQRLTLLLATERRRGLGETRDITLVINAIQEAIKRISNQIRRYGLFRGIQTGKLSFRSFDQKSLLKKCESIFFKALTASNTVCVLGNYYGNDLTEVINPETGKYIVTYVPLEGNSFMNYSLISGSIFSIYYRKPSKEPVSKEDFMQCGNSIVCAGYALYGQTTEFVLAPCPGGGLIEFMLDPDINEFILTNTKIEIPIHGGNYSMNEGRSRAMEPIILEAVNKKKSMHASRGRSLRCRYSGCIVADAHTILKSGGILIAPPYSDYNQGMLRHQFIGNPLAFIVVEAGGCATDGKEQVLDAAVDDPHQCKPLYMGSPKDHFEFERIIAGLYKIPKLNIYPLENSK